MEQVRLNVRIFKDEDPVLFHLLKSMPERSRSRQLRNLLRKLLCNADVGDVGDVGAQIRKRVPLTPKPSNPPEEEISALDDFNPKNCLKNLTP